MGGVAKGQLSSCRDWEEIDDEGEGASSDGACDADKSCCCEDPSDGVLPSSVLVNCVGCVLGTRNGSMDPACVSRLVRTMLFLRGGGCDCDNGCLSDGSFDDDDDDDDESRLRRTVLRLLLTGF